MSKLLHAGVRRYFRSKIFWIALGAALLLGLILGVVTHNEMYLEDTRVNGAFIIFAVLISIQIGTEHEDGIFRNKIISGHTKGKIFISELILGIGACLIIFLSIAALFTLTNTGMLSKLPADILIKTFLAFLCVNIAIAALFVTLSALIPHRAFSPIVCILIFLALMVAAASLHELLDRPQFLYDHITDHNGQLIPNGDPRQNPNYIGGALRHIFEFMLDFLPQGQIFQIMIIIAPLFDPYALNIFSDPEIIELFNFAPLYSIAFTIVISVVGYFTFTNKFSQKRRRSATILRLPYINVIPILLVTFLISLATIPFIFLLFDYNGSLFVPIFLTPLSVLLSALYDKDSSNYIAFTKFSILGLISLPLILGLNILGTFVYFKLYSGGDYLGFVLWNEAVCLSCALSLLSLSVIIPILTYTRSNRPISIIGYLLVSAILCICLYLTDRLPFNFEQHFNYILLAFSMAAAVISHIATRKKLINN